MASRGVAQPKQGSQWVVHQAARRRGTVLGYEVLAAELQNNTQTPSATELRAYGAAAAWVASILHPLALRLGLKSKGDVLEP